MTRKAVATMDAPSPLGHYSQAISVGDFVYTAGQTGIIPGTRDLTGPDIESQTRQALCNLKAILEAAGVSLQHVIKCNVYLQDFSDFPRMNAVYADFFPNDPPARCTVAVQLGLGALVEIEMVAFRGKPQDA